jgi:hypothetical protein
MKNGALIFAHNNRDVDYALMSLISGGLAKKHLGIPVTLVTDDTTVAWMKKSNIYDRSVEIFENIIIVKKPVTENQRRLWDGIELNKVVPFVNSNRASAYDLTPYDRTLLLDSDFLIFSDRLNEYWDSEDDVLIADSMNDIYGASRVGYHDKYISDTGIHMFWATTVMFTKNEYSREFFNLVNFVRLNYQYYGDLFRFNTQQYRNDIAFSIAKHIMNGFETDRISALPPLLTTIDKDILHSVDTNGKLTFLVSPMLDSNMCAAAIKNTDVHVMNKQSLVRNADALLELI